MGVMSVFYAALGYLGLLSAIVWGMLFVGDGSAPARMDGAGALGSFHAALADVALLLFLGLLHRWLSRSPLRWFIPAPLRRSTRAWGWCVVLVIVYGAWRPLPQVLWSLPGTSTVLFSALFYGAWTLVLVGTFLANNLDLFDLTHAGSVSHIPDSLSRLIYLAVLVGTWSTPVMSVGHLLLATAVSGYLLLATVSVSLPGRRMVPAGVPR